MTSIEPASKRAKVAAAEDLEEEDEEPEELWVTQPTKYINARAALKLRFATVDGIDDTEYEPEFVHQIFDGEAIACPPAERPLEMEVIYSASLLELTYRLAKKENKMEGATEAAMMKLAEALPEAVPSVDKLCDRARATFSPDDVAGALQSSYSVDAASDMTYEIRAADLGPSAPPECLSFAKRLQTLFLFCIETADAIDVTDERWRQLTVFEVRASGERRLVAAVTVFGFRRWLAGRGPMLLLRVCQATTLPPYRSKGHGAKLLRAVYAYAQTLGAAEVTVEDPNDSFAALRDLTDVRLCMEHGLMSELEHLGKAREQLLLTEEQLMRAYEIQQYMQLKPLLDATPSADEREQLLRPYRLDVKKRLNKKYKEDLDAIISIKTNALAAASAAEASRRSGDDAPQLSHDELIQARKRRLEELFQELLEEYDALISRL